MLVINRNQLDKLNQLFDRMPELHRIGIVEGTTGIGQTLEVVFDIFEPEAPPIRGEVHVDITDVGEW